METFESTAEFRAWCERYPEAWVVNVKGLDDEMLHRAKCPHLTEFTNITADLGANPKFGFYMRDRIRTYHPNARPCADCADLVRVEEHRLHDCHATCPGDCQLLAGTCTNGRDGAVGRIALSRLELLRSGVAADHRMDNNYRR
jgi:hypothetical protein